MLSLSRGIGIEVYTQDCQADELLSRICERIADVARANTALGDLPVIPVTSKFVYRDDGSLLFLIGNFCIICENNPPQKKEIMEIINDAYGITAKTLSVASGIPTKVEKIEEFLMPNSKQEWGVQVYLSFS